MSTLLLPGDIRYEIVATARSYVGTPFAHQGRLPGVGLDCVGIPVCTAHALGLSDFDRTDYARDPSEEGLERHCDEQAVRLLPGEQPGPGDMALFRIVHLPQHVAILGDYPGGGLSLIHAYSPLKKVVESYFDERWQRRVVAYYRLPGVPLWQG